MGGRPRVVRVEELEVGDLIEVRWLDASEARTSLSLPDREFDTPVRSIGVFGGLRGSRTKHIIVIKEEFAVAEAPEYHYNAIPINMVEKIVLARRKFWKKHDVRKAMSLLDGLGESSQVDVSRTPRVRKLAEEGAYFFPSTLVLKCVDPEFHLAEDAGEFATMMGHRRVELYAGLDLAKLRGQSDLAVVEREGRPEGHLLLRLLRAFPVGTPYSAVIAEVADVVRSLGVVALAVDRSGPGEVVFEQLAAELGAGMVLGFRFTAESKAELLSGLKVLMERGQLRLPYHRPLLAQLTTITCEMRPSGHVLFGHPPRGHDDMVMALALACWAARRPRGTGVRLA